MYKYRYNRASACTDVMSGFNRGPQTHDGVPILLLSLGPGGPIPMGSPKFYDTGTNTQDLRPVHNMLRHLRVDVCRNATRR